MCKYENIVYNKFVWSANPKYCVEQICMVSPMDPRSSVAKGKRLPEI